jgi:hypothetical protein
MPSMVRSEHRANTARNGRARIGPGRAKHQMAGDGLVSVTDVLEVVGDFEPFEPAGVGTGLVAWELHEHESAIAPVVEVALERGLLEYAGVDDRSGERLWRLTKRGRAALAAGG